MSVNRLKIKWSFFARKIQFKVLWFCREKCFVYAQDFNALFIILSKSRTVIIYVDRTQIHELPWIKWQEVWVNLSLFPSSKNILIYLKWVLYVGNRNGSSFKLGSLSWLCHQGYTCVMLVRNAGSQPHPDPQIRTCLLTRSRRGSYTLKFEKYWVRTILSVSETLLQGQHFIRAAGFKYDENQ